MSLGRISCALVINLWVASISLAAPVSDSELGAALVGSWVMPPDSGGNLLIAPSRQIFNQDGSTQVFLYLTAECRVPAALIEGRWWIKDGVLSTEVTKTTDPRLIPIGEVHRVLIVTVANHQAVFQADNQLHMREKSETCFPPGAHRT